MEGPDRPPVQDRLLLPNCGLDTIWLVNDDGEYEQTTDHEGLLRYFVIDKLSNETDLYGRKRPRLGRLRRPAGIKR